MKPKGATYTVVEEAGYLSEHDRRSGFKSAEAAWKWAERNYRLGDLNRLHVEVRRDCGKEKTYEF
jgi:hypothetical protein